MLWILFLVVGIQISTLVNAQSRRTTSLDEDANNAEPDHPIPMESIQGVAGQSATLPCNIQPREPNDTVSMVLWFKEDSGEPLYSFDARTRQAAKAKLWSAPSVWGSRASFRANAPAQLTIRDLRESDESLYRCRVDFRNSPTRNVKVNFTVIVPPATPIIYDAKRRDMSKLLEAYPEGTDLSLVCEVHGGKPRPRVAWFLNSEIINASSEIRESRGPGAESNVVTISKVTLKGLRRSHYHAKLSCKASNTHLAPPPTTTVVIELHMKPLKVEILGMREEILSAGKMYEVRCQSIGSKPPAVLTWWKASKQLKNTTKNFQEDGTSVSVLQWWPSVEDEGKFLVCRASNPKLPEASIEDRRKLKVYFRPIVTLKMGSSHNSKAIKEGDDVYFECNVKSNPRAQQLRWFHEEEELHYNGTAGIVLSDHSLVLQSITRESAGRYTCKAVNVAGPSTSNTVILDVMFAPICKHILKPTGPRPRQRNSTELVGASLNLPEENQVHGASRHEGVSLVCEVEANPTTVTFHWTFNSSGDLSDIPSTKYTSEGTSSRLNYTPSSDMDYGTLACWASNIAGSSKQPCLHQLVAAGRPYPLQNCTAYNQSGSRIRISCIEGYDGGLPQTFLALVDNEPLKSSSPSWELELHRPTTVTLFAVNSKGQSDPVVMEDVAWKGSAKYTDESASSIDMSPILIGLGGTATGLGLIVTGVLMALWRRHAATPTKPKPTQQPNIATFAGKTDEEDGNPDLIPTTVLTNHLADRKPLLYGPRQLQGCTEMIHDVLADSNYPRVHPNTFYSLERRRDSETIIRSATIQESSI